MYIEKERLDHQRPAVVKRSTFRLVNLNIWGSTPLVAASPPQLVPFSRKPPR